MRLAFAASCFSRERVCFQQHVILSKLVVCTFLTEVYTSTLGCYSYRGGAKIVEIEGTK